MATTITKKNKEMTLLQAIERVVELAEDSKMSKVFMKGQGGDSIAGQELWHHGAGGGLHATAGWRKRLC